MSYLTNTANKSGVKPRQKISYAAKDKKWADETADYYRGVCIEAVNREDALKNYRLANGQLDEKEYLYVTNPLNTTRPELLGAPARLMNWDIITPNFNLLMGEKARRAFPPIVYAKNSTYHIEALQKEQSMLVNQLQKMFVNEAIAQGIPLEEEKITMKLEEIAGRVKNLPDTLASLGQDTLEYIMDLNQLPRNFRKGFYDWLAQACVYSYKDVHKNQTYYEIISPIFIRYLCSSNHDFIQDGEAVVADHSMSINEIYDRFQDSKGFEGELEKYISDYSNFSSSSTGSNVGYRVGSTDIISARAEMFDNVFGNKIKEEYANGLRVEHVMWRSQTKRGILRVPDVEGNMIEYEVDDTFKPMEGEEVEWRWHDEIWENYCIADRFWLGAACVPIQNQVKARLLYNGRNMLSRHTRPKPLVKRGEAYQKSVNIIKYRAEMTLAKNLDKIILFPLGLIPKKEGWDEDKLMYYVRSFSFLFFDDTRPNAHLLINAMKDLDVSSLQHVIQAYQLVQILKQEWDEACGIIPQRKGQVGTSAGMAVTQEANDRSYVMSEEMFMEYEEFEREEYEGMLEIAKFAFSEGIQSHFVRQDGTKAFLDLHDPETFLWLQMGVFVKNGTKEFQKLELLRGQVTAFAQNGSMPKEIAAIVEAENFSKLHEIMDSIQMDMDARTEQAQRIEAEKTAAAERMAAGVEQFKYYAEDLKSYTAIQVALIDAGIAMSQQLRTMEAGGQQGTEGYTDTREGLERNMIELAKNATKLKDIASKQTLKREEIASKERMNKLDNKTALKNKVAGEK